MNPKVFSTRTARFGVGLLLLLNLLSFTLSAQAPPNDSCAYAIPISCDTTFSGSTVAATPDIGTDCIFANPPDSICNNGICTPNPFANQLSNGVWYKFTGTGAGMALVIDGNGTDYQAVIRVFTGTCGALTEIASSLKIIAGSIEATNKARFSSLPGVEYHILVDGYCQSFGNFQISTHCVPNDLCEFATPISCDQTLIGSTTYAVEDLPYYCPVFVPGDDGKSPSIWYKVTGTGETMALVVDTAYSDFWVEMEVYSGTSCGTKNFLARNNYLFFGDILSFYTEVGLDYYIKVDGFCNEEGGFKITTHCLENDVCASATPIQCGQTISGSTIYASSDGSGYCSYDPNNQSPAPANGVWYKLTGNQDIVTVNISNVTSPASGIDVLPQVVIYAGTCGSLSEVKHWHTPQLSGSFQANAGTDYYIFVAGNCLSRINFDLTVTCTPGPSVPLGTSCTTATPIACGQTISGPFSVYGTPTIPLCPTGSAEKTGFWFQYTGDGSLVVLDACDPNLTFLEAHSINFYVYTGDCNALTCVDSDVLACFSGATFQSVAGTVYHIFMTVYSETPGNFALNLSCISPEPPPNDLCANAIQISNGQHVIGQTLTATTAHPTCANNYYGPDEDPFDVWYTGMGTGNDIVLDFGNTNFPVRVLGVLDSCNGPVCFIPYSLIPGQIIVPTLNNRRFYLQLFGEQTLDENFNLIFTKGTFEFDVTCPACCPPGNVLYVDADATGVNSGSSWANAFTDLQSALASTCPGITQIWVAAGTYKPTSGTDRSISFVMKNNLAIYGGFSGTETQLSQRNWTTNVTTLSGEIGAAGIDDNSYHVIFNNNNGLNSSAVLDGFTVTAGNSNGPGNNFGGGMANRFSSPTVTNCIFFGNSSPSIGGGMSNFNSSHPTVTNCSFTGNSANGPSGGGGIANGSLSFPNFTNCTISGNSPNELTYSAGFPTFTNCIIWGSHNLTSSNSNVTYSIIQGGHSGTGNLNLDPLFVSATDLHIQQCSPARDNGTATGAPATDFDGNARPQGPGIDMGFDEFVGAPCCPSGNVLYVKANATGTNNGFSWANAFTDLQSALVNTCPGITEIWVAAGTYKPTSGTDRNIRFSLKNNLAIYGGFNGTETQLSQRNWTTNVTTLSGEIGAAGNADNSLNVVLSAGNNNTAILDGFTVTMGYSDVTLQRGGGMYVDINSSPSIANCIFSENTAIYGGGVYLRDNSTTSFTNCSFQANHANEWGGGMFTEQNTSPTLTDCSFSSNTANYGGGMFNRTATPTMTNCSFSGNTANQNGGGMYNDFSATPTLTKCSFSANSANFGGAVFNDNATPSLTNCSFSGNSANQNGGAMYNESASPTVTNCSFSGNSASNGGGMLNSSASPTVKNCILWGNSSGIFSFNNSNPTVTYSIIQGGYSGTGNLNLDPLFVSATDLHIQQCSPARDAGTATGAPATDYDGNARPQGPGIDMGFDEFVGAACCPSGNVLYVKANATGGANNGTSWANAFTDLQSALNSTCPGITQIWVAAGTYKPTSGTDRNISFVMKNNLAIYGGFNGTETQLSQRNWTTNVTTLSGDIGTVGDNSDNSFHVVFNNNNGLSSSAVLDGFTITAGNTSGAPGNNFGGGMINKISSPTVTNCIFSGNFGASSGGGMANFNFSNPTVTNCIFLGNSAFSGGGMANNTSASPTVTNCSFSGNSASVGGGIDIRFTSSPTITNCIIWGNSSGISNSTQSNPTFTYSIVQGGYAGTGNLDVDPLFVQQPPIGLGTTGDLHLQACSPARDAGTNTGAPATDYDNEARPNGTTVDMGFDEFTGPPITFTVPANGGSTVACPALANVQPTPPAVSNTCNQAITPTGPNVSATPVCEGTKTYTWTYTYNNVSLDWVYTYTIEREPFTIPANGAATVACPALAVAPATLPTVTSACGETLSPTGPVVTNAPNPVTCEGTRTYAYTYTDCEGNSAVWSFVYTIEREPFTIPANGSATVACPALAVAPATLPTVTSACGETLTPTGPVVTNTPNPVTCEGTRTYAYTYTDCEGNTAVWSFVYTIEREPFTVPANGAAAVACPALAIAPATLPTVTSACGETLTPSAPVITNVPNPLTCEGTRTYAYTYTDCEGNTAVWSFTYTIERQPFTISTPNGAATVACAALASAPAPPSVTSNCGEPLTPIGPVIINNPNPVLCAGTRTYLWTYTDCEGNTAAWSFVYTITPVAFSVPTNGAATVACPALATQPVPPIVADACGNPTTPSGPVITNSPAPVACEGTRTYTWTYTDCAGNTTPWSFVYTIEREPFTVPANGVATVACPALAIAPATLPTVTSACGETLTPTGPVITNVPNPLTCEGTRTYAYIYTDCEGNTATWRFTYTIERLPFTVPANGSAMVSCPSQSDVQPAPPVVTSNCGEVLAPVVTRSLKPGCEGNRSWYFTYTDCEGNTATWAFIYTVEYADFVVPPSITYNVECPLSAQQPVPPTVLDNCGKVITPSGPVITNSANEQGCESSRTYTWIYKDCEGNTHTWGVTYNFQYEADFFAPQDEVNVVGCLSYAVPPVPQTLYDICGQKISVSGPEVTELPGETPCSGTKIYTFVYTDCGGHSHPWTFTVHAIDNEPPVGNCQNTEFGGLSCPEEIPCPDGDHSAAIAYLLEKGEFKDLCSGTELTVTIDSWTEFSPCNDSDGDGIFTFSRTYYFVIADACGNRFPDLCSVTYSGECQPIGTLPAIAWSQYGGEQFPQVSPSVIQSLLDSYGPLVIGGSNGSLTIKDANCLVQLMPGGGYPSPLQNCHQLDCEIGCNPSGDVGLSNTLATNVMGLQLSLWMSAKMYGVDPESLGEQGLGCFHINENIVSCGDGGCVLHLFSLGGEEYVFPYTLNGLMELVDVYLSGDIELGDGESGVYATALEKTLLELLAYYGEGGDSQTGGCPPGASATGSGNGMGQAFWAGNTEPIRASLVLAPNPASRELNVRLLDLGGARDVSMEVYNSHGQPVLRKEFGSVAMLDEQLDLVGLGNGLYLVVVRAGSERFERKLVVFRD